MRRTTLAPLAALAGAMVQLTRVPHGYWPLLKAT
jgi:hypothetical protein